MTCREKSMPMTQSPERDNALHFTNECVAYTSDHAPFRAQGTNKQTASVPRHVVN